MFVRRSFQRSVGRFVLRFDDGLRGIQLIRVVIIMLALPSLLLCRRRALLRFGLSSFVSPGALLSLFRLLFLLRLPQLRLPLRVGLRFFLGDLGLNSVG